MDWIRDHLWETWLGLSIVLGVAEMFSLDLILAMLAAGAVIGMVAAIIGLPVFVQILAALAASIAMLAFVRPAFVKRLHSGPELALGHGKLVGTRALVTQEITGLAPGRIKVAGEVWSALPYDEHLKIAAGRDRRDLPDQGRDRLRPPGGHARALTRRRTPPHDRSTASHSNSQDRGEPMGTALLVLLLLVVLFVVVMLAKTVRIVPQARAGIVERFGKYKGTLPAGLNIVIPFIDRLRYLIDLREQVVSFPPQPVITEDNLVVSIDTVIYFQVTDPVAATYEIANYIQAIEQLTMTTLRNIVGGMDLEETLTSRDSINSGLRGVLDEATGKWGIRVNRVELKGIDPPPSIKDSMEKQMRADREKRAVILTAEGQRQAAILTAEGSKQSQILNAEGDRESQILRAQADREAQILRAQGEGQAIQTVFQAIHDGQPDQSLLAYQYLQMMPKIAEGSANKVWVIPSEITKAMEGLGSSIHEIAGIPKDATPRTRVDMGSSEPLLPRSSGRPGDTGRPTRPCSRRSPRPRAPPTRGAPRGRSTRPRPPPTRTPTTPLSREHPPASESDRSGADRPRRSGGRHHQHRGGVGNVDHVPDPPRVRRTPGDRQRQQHRRARPGQHVRRLRLPP